MIWHIYIYIYIYIYNSLNTLSGGKRCLVVPEVAVPPWATITVLSPLVGSWCGHGIACAFTRCMMKKKNIYIYINSYIYIYIYISDYIWLKSSGEGFLGTTTAFFYWSFCIYFYLQHLGWHKERLVVTGKENRITNMSQRNGIFSLSMCKMTSSC